MASPRPWKAGRTIQPISLAGRPFHSSCQTHTVPAGTPSASTTAYQFVPAPTPSTMARTFSRRPSRGSGPPSSDIMAGSVRSAS